MHPNCGIAAAPTDRPPVRGAILTGLAAVALGLGGFTAWSAAAPLASAAIAPGVIVADSNRKTVQHLEGGIIAELLVREGDQVDAGQALVRLDDLEARSLHALLLNEYFARAAAEARLEAERAQADRLVFPPDLEAERRRPEVGEILAGQERIFTGGQTALEGLIAVQGQRIAQLRAQIGAIQGQVAAGAEQLALIREEIEGVRRLVDNGLERKPRLLALERQGAALAGQQGEYLGRIAMAQEGIAEAELQILNARQMRVERAALELRDVQARRAEVQEKLAAAAMRLNRREVVAPQKGTVLDLRYQGTGSVVPPGGAVLDLVPQEDRLVVEAKVSPADMDVVHAGLPAKIVLTALNRRTTPQIDGTVIHVSADALTEQRTGQTYFRARVEMAADQLSRSGGALLTPGMPAEAVIETGARTMLDYFVRPIADSFRHAFRES